MAYDRSLVDRLLRESRDIVLEELRELFEQNRPTGYGPLYDLLADYPFREGKSLRPAILLASARAAGGHADQARLSAAALELYHNAFLVHDDVEDESDFRRGEITMLRSHGTAVAVNVGDATNVLAMQLLLRNAEVIGLRRALLVLREVERMARESVEGQAIELDWIRQDVFDLDDQDYVRMAYKKTCWYTVIAPLRMGVLCGCPAGTRFPMERDLAPLIELGHLAGIAFQICDDLLNLEADEVVYGKETAGDLWEGKRTIMLLHFLRECDAASRSRALAVLCTSRRQKNPEDVQWLLDAMIDQGSLRYGHRMAEQFVERATALNDGALAFYEDNEDRHFLREMLWYVVERAS
jgi:geranylgeranyl diphosphate synthase, type II